MHRRQQKSAFTLLEIAMVLAVLGLVAGGIIGGKQLIYVSKLHAVVDDALNYAISKQQFKDKYGEFPGDFSQATKIWGTPFTANGNGNDKIDTAAEGYLAWQHLAAAGMIKGNYTGVVAGSAATPAVNIPAGSFNNSGYFWLGTWAGQPTAAQFYDGDYTNAFVFGQATAASWPSGAVLTAMDASQLDKKNDDALPAFGNVRSFSSKLASNSNCVADDAGTPPTSASATYKTSDMSPACVLIFMNTFKEVSKF